jgi:hypothetical protein
LRAFKALDGTAMDALQQLWHLLNLLLPPLAVAGLHAAACKLLWRRELGRVGMLRLWGWCALAAEAINLAGLVWTGHDGAMLTYGAIVAVLSLTSWLVAFTPWRRSPG